MTQILFLDILGDVSKLILKKKISSKSDFFCENRSKSSLKIAGPGLTPLHLIQDSEYVWIFNVDPVEVPENWGFLTQSGADFSVFVFVFHGKKSLLFLLRDFFKAQFIFMENWILYVAFKRLTFHNSIQITSKKRFSSLVCFWTVFTWWRLRSSQLRVFSGRLPSRPLIFYPTRGELNWDSVFQLILVQFWMRTETNGNYEISSSRFFSFL